MTRPVLARHFNEQRYSFCNVPCFVRGRELFKLRHDLRAFAEPMLLRQRICHYAAADGDGWRIAADDEVIAGQRKQR